MVNHLEGSEVGQGSASEINEEIQRYEEQRDLLQAQLAAAAELKKSAQGKEAYTQAIRREDNLAKQLRALEANRPVSIGTKQSDLEQAVQLGQSKLMRASNEKEYQEAVRMIDQAKRQLRNLKP